MKVVSGALCRIIEDNFKIRVCFAQCGDKVLALKTSDFSPMVWAINLRTNKRHNYMKSNLEVISESR
jgi:selenophosphate synthetase-related protein